MALRRRDIHFTAAVIGAVATLIIFWLTLKNRQQIAKLQQSADANANDHAQRLRKLQVSVTDMGDTLRGLELAACTQPSVARNPTLANALQCPLPPNTNNPSAPPGGAQIMQLPATMSQGGSPITFPRPQLVMDPMQPPPPMDHQFGHNPFQAPQQHAAGFGDMRASGGFNGGVPIPIGAASGMRGVPLM